MAKRLGVGARRSIAAQSMPAYEFRLWPAVAASLKTPPSVTTDIMPLMEVDESSWVMMRVVTLHEDHYRAAVSAPWYIDFDGRPRVGKKSVEFFQAWLSEYEERLKKLPPAELQRHVPFVKSARAFWAAKAETAVP